MKQLPLILLLAACAPMDEQQRYESDDRLIQARELYVLRREACRQSGGIMEIRSRGKVGRHEYADYKTAKCVRYAR